MPCNNKSQVFFVLIILLVSLVLSRSLPSSRPENLLSETNLSSSSSSASATEECCEQTYGFMPCTTTALGNLFLMCMYGYLMFKAANFLSNGNEVLIHILGPGIVDGYWGPKIVGGLFLPLLVSVPDAMIILVSGLSESKEKAQSRISSGMGLLAGSTITLLTVVWGSCVVAGKCDIKETDSMAIDGQNKKGFSLTGTGVSTDIWTCYIARIMATSAVPFVAVQLSQLSPSTSGRHLAILICLIVSFLVLICYCLYQVSQPRIQQQRLVHSERKLLMLGILRLFNLRVLRQLLKDDGEPNLDNIKLKFAQIDMDGDGYISFSELKALLVLMGFEEKALGSGNGDDAMILQYFANSEDNRVGLIQFAKLIITLLNQIKQESGPQLMKRINDSYTKERADKKLLGAEKEEEEFVGFLYPGWNSLRAIMMLVVGTIIAVAFADPLVDAVNNFSSATGIPTFIASFIALPLATKSGEAIVAITVAREKKLGAISSTFSEAYGGITVENLLCLSVFLALIYVRGLLWNFSSEVLAIFIVYVVMGVIAGFRTTLPLWTALVAYFLYLFSLGLICVLQYVGGWT